MINCNQNCKQGRACDCSRQAEPLHSRRDFTEADWDHFYRQRQPITMECPDPGDYWDAVTWRDIAVDLGVAICVVLVAGVSLGYYSGLFARADVVWPGHWLIHFLGGL